jgi:hypothetical protein
MRFVKVQIGPTMAAELLASNERNRHLSSNTVDAYSRDMIAGRWPLNPQPIMVTPDGRILDGQHRLAAVIKSGCEICFWVCYDVIDSAQEVVDKGRARTFSDGLRIAGHHAASRCAATARSLLLMERDFKDVSRKVTDSELGDAFSRYRTGLAWVERAQLRPRLSRAPYLAILVCAYPAFREEVEIFHEQVQGGARLAQFDPALTLRTWMLERLAGVGGNRRDIEISLKTASAFEASLTGKQLQKLQIGDAGIRRLRMLIETVKEPREGPLSQGVDMAVQ